MRLIVSNNADHFIECEARLEKKTKSERLGFGFKNFFMWFFLALVSIFIPVAHFVLVPVFLITSMISFKNAFKIKNRIILNKVAVCCSCQKDLKIPEGFNNELSVECQYCGERYKIEI